MSKRVSILFDDPELAARYSFRLTAWSPDEWGAGYPYIYPNDETAFGVNPPGLYRVPVDSHVRVYQGVRLLGIYCGHSREIESGWRMRYSVMGYAEVYCPHSQEWEPLG